MIPKNSFFRTVFIFSSVLFLISLLAILLSWKKLPPEIPLYYSQPWGTEQLAKPANLFILPFANFLVLLFTLLINKLIPQENFLLQIFSLTALLFSFLACLTLIKIIFLVI